MKLVSGEAVLARRVVATRYQSEPCSHSRLVCAWVVQTIVAKMTVSPSWGLQTECGFFPGDRRGGVEWVDCVNRIT